MNGPRHRFSLAGQAGGTQGGDQSRQCGTSGARLSGSVAQPWQRLLRPAQPEQSFADHCRQCGVGRFQLVGAGQMGQGVGVAPGLAEHGTVGDANAGGVRCDVDGLAVKLGRLVKLTGHMMDVGQCGNQFRRLRAQLQGPAELPRGLVKAAQHLQRHTKIGMGLPIALP